MGSLRGRFQTVSTLGILAFRRLSGGSSQRVWGSGGTRKQPSIQSKWNGYSVPLKTFGCGSSVDLPTLTGTSTSSRDGSILQPLQTAASSKGYTSPWDCTPGSASTAATATSVYLLTTRRRYRSSTLIC